MGEWMGGSVREETWLDCEPLPAAFWPGLTFPGAGMGSAPIRLATPRGEAIWGGYLGWLQTMTPPRQVMSNRPWRLMAALRRWRMRRSVGSNGTPAW